MEEPVQKSLERYDVLDRIAVGGMAEVFLAKAYGAHGFEKTLAIKRILPELASDPEFAARFIAEAKVAVRLSHANIVQVFDFGRIGESLFIAMEYVDGLDLAAMLRKFKDEGRPVPLPAAFHIAIEIIRALDFAHGHNVVHRDVSPSNILISRAGEVKIADFGIAVAAQPHRGGGPGPRKVMGKWRYMSPEQARGDTLDTRSDLFSAASVIFELFTGTKLFPGDEAEDIAKNIHEMPIPRMASLRPGLPSRLDDVIGQALARKPIDRPSRPATVLRSLIELSYESSIMATALDVADALATVIPAKRQSGRGALDDVIRKQLNDPPTAARRTAVTDGKPPSTQTAAEGVEPATSTGLFRKLGADGLASLEIDNTKVAAPRARRNSEQGDVMPGDTDVHRLFEKSMDRDRHTEVGGPPTGQIPKDYEEPEPDSQTRLKTTGSSKSLTTMQTGADAPTSNTKWIVLAVLALGGIGAGIFVLTRPDKPVDDPIVNAPKDGGIVTPPPDTTATVMLTTTPPGATGTVNGQPLTTRTPVRMVGVPIGKAKIHLELDGYLPLDQEIEVIGGNNNYTLTFASAPAKLHVTTDPVGASVSLGGRNLGITPLDRADLSAVKDATLTLSKQGFETLTFKVTLVAGKQLEIDRALKAAQKFGIAEIRVRGGFGDVYLSGKKIGFAPAQKLKLPIGSNKLTLINNEAKPPIKWDLICSVTEAGPNICETKQP
ncbi:MAG: serine/threonine protein kinase [Deltaproteobacteria bacterium]|nr:serine/threonine protein kinase [Deltaproteobacteria bacterium]